MGKVRRPPADKEVGIEPARDPRASRLVRPTRSRPAASLIFPAYNARACAERTWREVERRLPPDWEVLFVCDGCTDGTPALLAELTRPLADRVRVLTHAPNRGKGYAVRRGLAEATGRWRIFADIDLAYGWAEVRRVALALRAGADVALASRTHPASRAALPTALLGYAARRQFQSDVFSWFVRRLLPLRVRDTQAGLKGLSARAVRLLVPRLGCDGFGFDCELLTAAGRLGLRLTEVPVRVRYDDRRSTTGLRAAAGMLRELWRIRQTWCGPDFPAPAPPAARLVCRAA
jgi:dolichyl-phosphate beta-glucosyltransferase